MNNNWDTQVNQEETKVRDLANRFNNLRDNVTQQRKKRILEIEEFINLLNNKLSDNYQDVQIDKLKNTLYNLQETISKEQDSVENLNSTTQKQIKIIEESFNQSLEELKNTNKNLWADFIKQTEEKFFSLNLNLSKSRKLFNENLEDQKNTIINNLEEINENLENEKNMRLEGNNEIENQILDQLNKIKEEILIEKKIREETNEKIKNLIDETQMNFQKEIDIEKKNRELTNNSLLNLLDEACNKIERNFTYNGN